jgi:hypothetical protein
LYDLITYVAVAGRDVLSLFDLDDHVLTIAVLLKFFNLLFLLLFFPVCSST